LDFGETWEACAYREIAEECGENFRVSLRRVDPHRLEYFVTNDIMLQYDNHYITIFMVADWIEGEPENTEPEKCEGWEWLTFEEVASLAQHRETANWIPMELLAVHRRSIGF